MEPNGRALCEAKSVERIAAAAHVFVDGAISDPSKMMEYLGRIEAHGALGF
jgi:hypothetical protein